jgi:hypothetical protein
MNYDFNELGKIDKYVKRPKNQEPKLLKSKKLELGNTQLKSKYKTWNVSAQASSVSGIKNRGRSAKFVDYIARKEECLALYSDENAKEKFKELDDKLLSKRKNLTVQKRFVIPLPKEFLNNPEKLTEKFGKQLFDKYFSNCYAFSMALHAGGKDFKNPHFHVAYSVVDNSLKNIRELNNKNFPDEIRKNIAQFIESELQIKCVLKQGKAIKHYPKWVAAAYERAQKDQTGKLLKEYSERYAVFAEYASERERKRLEREIASEKRDINILENLQNSLHTSQRPKMNKVINDIKNIIKR